MSVEKLENRVAQARKKVTDVLFLSFSVPFYGRQRPSFDAFSGLFLAIVLFGH